MSEERLQEIKDSIEFQYTLAKAKGYDNALLFTNEEEELVEEIERLNNIINKLERLVDDYAWNSYYFKCGNRYLKSEILNDIREIIELKGSDKE